MPAGWSITQWPVCEYHVFLSHCAEDRKRLVLPVYRRLQQSGITPWIDQHDYPSGRDPFESLRENLLRCRHIVYFI
ncbi:MAG TPA: toll/interleukin-1 receptor domain-containing protein, partial [Planctomycetaceae bacterium]|nr:toll/interleukin-1 receptor domain-containing protein [Planctomycetaceae bacterium]